MRIIDFHTHTFPDAVAPAAIDKLQRASHTLSFTDGTVGQLRQSMQAAGIFASVVLPVATHPRQVVKINDASLQLNEQAGMTGVFSLGCMHPDFEDWEAELTRIARRGLRGIKLHPIYQGVDLDDPRFLRILAKCGDLGLLVLIHAGLDVGFPGVVHASPRMILRAFREVGPLTLILAHMGGWRCWDEVEELLPGHGLFIDTSFSLGHMTPNGDGYYQGEEDTGMLEEAQFLRLIRAFGSSHTLFGTDCPWGNQKTDVTRFLALPLTQTEKELILYRNAAALLGLNDHKKEDTVE